MMTKRSSLHRQACFQSVPKLCQSPHPEATKPGANADKAPHGPSIRSSPGPKACALRRVERVLEGAYTDGRIFANSRNAPPGKLRQACLQDDRRAVAARQRHRAQMESVSNAIQRSKPGDESRQTNTLRWSALLLYRVHARAHGSDSTVGTVRGNRSSLRPLYPPTPEYLMLPLIQAGARFN